VLLTNIEAIPALVRRLYAVVRDLEAAFPGRHFTPDGHLVGTLGEVLAAHCYGLDLLPASAKAHDAIAEDGRLVQIKATQGKSVGLRSCCDHLLVLKLDAEGGFEEVYNGPGGPVLEAASRMQSNGQQAVGLGKLRMLAEGVKPEDRISRKVR
jgi:hypothetical protein